ncbi:hypothetical protein ACFU6S_21765 [Streptomyces sp. NPDC057456]|uniref:hypothetical protein n=1 Tax=Streptomyces sp. NPDC057456 TaxID=3346139 RepID=UPI003683000D
MAWDWGHCRHQEFQRTPAAAHVGDQGDSLIATAVVQGAFSKVAAELVEGCFGDPDLIDDMFPGEETTIRHAMEHEHLFLKQRAQSAAAHIRKLAGGLCTCGQLLYLGPEADVPARYCSKYGLASRSAKGHRTQIREAFGFRTATRADEERLTAWLADEICPVELVEDRLREALSVRCRSDRIEPPGRIVSVRRSAW